MQLAARDALSLARRGLAIVPNFISESTADAARAQIQLGERLNEATLGSAGQDASVRADKIRWTSPEQESGAMAEIIGGLRSLPRQIEEGCAGYWGAGELLLPPKCMVSRYSGPAGHYVSHLDGVAVDVAAKPAKSGDELMRELIASGGLDDVRSFMKDAGGAMAEQNQRKHRRREVTSILYLNDAAWDADEGADGGALRCQLGEGAAAEFETVAPRGGTLVLFKSRLIPHEVLPTRRDRFALSLWIEAEPKH